MFKTRRYLSFTRNTINKYETNKTEETDERRKIAFQFVCYIAIECLLDIKNEDDIMARRIIPSQNR